MALAVATTSARDVSPSPDEATRVALPSSPTPRSSPRLALALLPPLAAAYLPPRFVEPAGGFFVFLESTVRCRLKKPRVARLSASSGRGSTAATNPPRRKSATPCATVVACIRSSVDAPQEEPSARAPPANDAHPSSFPDHVGSSEADESFHKDDFFHMFRSTASRGGDAATLAKTPPTETSWSDRFDTHAPVPPPTPTHPHHTHPAPHENLTAPAAPPGTWDTPFHLQKKKKALDVEKWHGVSILSPRAFAFTGAMHMTQSTPPASPISSSPAPAALSVASSATRW